MSQASWSRRKASRVLVLVVSNLECAIWMAICQSLSAMSRQLSSSSWSLSNMISDCRSRVYVILLKWPSSNTSILVSSLVMSGLAPQPTIPSTPPTYAAPSHQNLAAVAATVTVVGLFMALLIIWLVFRLRRASDSQQIPVSRRPSSYPFRPSFAPSEASSRFGFSMCGLPLALFR